MSRQPLRDLLARDPLSGLAEVAADHPGRVALVGGAIRDRLLDLPVRDLDLVVEEGLEGFLDALERRVGRRPASIGDRFQETHRFRWAGLQVDVARSLGPIEEDLGRRDFTVNALGLLLPAGEDPVAELIDPYGGRPDLEGQRLRETAEGVIAADPLRVLRGVRYAASLPGFRLLGPTRETLRAVAPSLLEVAAERKVAEWAEILQLVGWVEGLTLALELGALDHGLAPASELRAVRAWAAGEGTGSADARARLAALFFDLSAGGDAETLASRMRAARWPRSLVRHAARVARWAGNPDVSEKTSARRALEDSAAAADAAELCLRLDREVKAARRLGRHARRACEERWIRGADLVGMGLSPGPRVGELLEELALGQMLRRWSGADEARAWARDRVEREEAG